jgi:hypothetical protein
MLLLSRVLGSHRTLFLAAGVLLIQTYASADTVGLSASAVAEASVLPGSQHQTGQFSGAVASGVTVGPFSPDVSYTNGVVTGEGTAQVFGYVQFGLIAGFVSASGTGTAGGEGQASWQGIWQDTLTITSTTLAAGSPVDLQFSLFVGPGTVSCSGTNSVANAEGTFSAGVGNPIGITLLDETCNTGFKLSQTMTLATTVGAQIPVEGQELLNADAASLDITTSTASVDPSDSFFIDSLTPGASYTTASGATYFTPPITPAPEPSSLLLFGTGLLTLIGARRKSIG